MSDGFKDHNTTNPAVHEVVSVERDVEQLDQWVVTASEQEQRKHVHHRQHARAVSDLSGNVASAPMDTDNAEGNVHCKVAWSEN